MDLHVKTLLENMIEKQEYQEHQVNGLSEIHHIHFLVKFSEVSFADDIDDIIYIAEFNSKWNNDYDELCSLYYHLREYQHKHSEWTPRLSRELMDSVDSVDSMKLSGTDNIFIPNTKKIIYSKIITVQKIKYTGNGLYFIRSIMNNQSSCVKNYWHIQAPISKQLNKFNTYVYDNINMDRNLKIEKLHKQIKDNNLPIFKTMKILYKKIL